MALTDAIRTPLAPSDYAAENSLPENYTGLRAAQIAGSSQFARGWESAGIGGDAQALKAKALHAYNAGDEAGGKVLEMQADDLQQQAAQWAPRVQNLTDVRSLRDGLDWAGGALGNVRTSVAPAVGGLVGGAVGALAAPITGGVINPVNAGFAGASLAGYDMEANEAIAQAMNDPYIRARHSYQEILDASRVKGGINAMLEAAVPAAMGGKLLGQGAKGVVGAGWKGAARAVGSNVAKDAAGEFATEGTQSLVGQGAQNYLQDKPVGDFDYKQAFNEGAAGAIAGGGMGVVGGLGEVGHARLGQVADKATDVAADPLGTAAYAAGKALAPKPEVSVYDKILSGEVSPKDALVKGGDAETNQRAAEAHALSVLQNPDASEQERADAVEFKNNVAKNPEGATNLYRDKLTIDHHETKQGESYTDIVDEIKQRTEPTTRSSKMRAAKFGDIEYEVPASEPMRDPRPSPGVSDANTALGGRKSPGENTRAAYLGAEAKRLAGLLQRLHRTVQPKGEPLTGAKLQQLETVADIWRKQGVDDKLLKATSDKTEGAQRAMAISVLGWVQRGMKDYDGNLFVPEALTRAYKGKSAEMIRNAVELAQGEGLITAEQAQHLPEIEKMATAQHVEHTDLVSTVAAALKPSLRVKGVDSEQIRAILPDLTRIAVHGARGEGTTKGGTTRGQYGVSEKRSATDRDALVALFGSEDNALPVLAKLYERAKGSKPELLTEKASSENESEDAGSDALDYEDKQVANEVGAKGPTFAGFGKDNTPFDTQDTYQKGYLAEHTAKGASNESKRVVGVWQRVKDQFADDPEALHEAETTILDEHAHDYLKPAQREAMEHYGVSAGTAVNEAPALMRRAILAKIDQRFKLVRTEVMNDGDALAFTVDDMNALKLDKVGFGKNSQGKEVVSTGKLILERADVKTNYVTSAPMIIAKMFGLKDTATESNSENATGGATKRLDLLGQGLTSLLAIEGKFTGRVGYVTEAGGDVTWMKLEDAKNKVAADSFPAELPLNGDRTITVADATKQRADNLGKNEDKFAKVGLATTQIGMERELRKLMDSPETSKKFAGFIASVLKNRGDELKADAARKIADGGPLAREKGWRLRDLYQDLRNDIKLDPNDLVAGNRHDQPLGSNTDREANRAAIAEELAYQQKLIAQTRKNGQKLPANVDKPNGSGKNVNGTTGQGESDPSVSPNDVHSDDSVQGMLRASDPKIKEQKIDSAPYAPKNTFPEQAELTKLEARSKIGEGSVVSGLPAGTGQRLTMAEHARLRELRKAYDAWALSSMQGTSAPAGAIQRDDGRVRVKDENGDWVTEQGSSAGMTKGDAAGYSLAGSSRVNTKNGERITESKPRRQTTPAAKPSDTSYVSTNTITDDHGNVVQARGKRVDVPAGSVSTRAAEVGTSPLATVKVEEKSLGSSPAEIKAAGQLENMKDSVFAKLRVSVTNLLTAAKTLSDEQFKVMRTALEFFAKMGVSVTGDDFRKLYDKTLTNEQAASIVKRARNALKELDGMLSARPSKETTNGATPAKRDGADTARPAVEGKDGNTQTDTRRGAAVPVVGQAKGTGQAGQREAGVAEKYKVGDRFVTTRIAGSSEATTVRIAGVIEHAGEQLLIHKDERLGKYVVTEPRTMMGIGVAEKTLKEALAKATDKLTTLTDTQFLKAINDNIRQNSQTPEGKAATQAERDAAAKHLIDTLGDTVDRTFKPFFKDGSSGVWQKGATKNVIRLALNGDVLGTAYHESMHELFSILGKHGGENVQQFLQRVATQGIVMKKLEQLLAHHPEALKQLADPEEAAAYMYQFWRAGMLKLGPQATTLFEKIKQALKQVFGKITAEIKDQQHAETIMQAFSNGAMKDGAVQEAAVQALMKNTAQHEAALTRVGENYKKFADVGGKYFYSAEGMMESTKNKHIVELSTLFNQKAGAAMKSAAGVVGTFFDAVPRTRAQYMNKLENILQQPGLDKADIELVREALSTGTPSNLPRIQKVVEQMKGFNDELMNYAMSRDISKLDDNGQWVKMTSRKDFGMPQVWDVEAVQKNPQALKDDLLATHPKELEAIAKKATAEALSQMQDVQKKMGPAAQAAFDKAVAEFKASGKIMAPLNIQNVTADMVADAIVARIMNSGGHVGPHETTSNLGITPMAASVNKRSLSWVDPKVFDKYKQKDLINIYSSYVTSMTKRGEYTARFGNGGEKIRDLTDKAFLSEMGGDKLVEQTNAALPERIKQWAKNRAAAMKAGEEFNAPYPTLRSVGSELHSSSVGTDKFLADAQAATKALYQATRAVQALEGTLGIDITPGVRTLNGILVTYQSLRLLSTSLFSSMSDIVGIPLNGGKIGDAWEAFVRGIREVKLSAWDDSKSEDYAAKRSELWGSVDAVSFNDAIGQGYGGMYLTGKAKQFSDTFFKKIGMEGWNRGMRISATMVGERIITEMANGHVDMTDKAAKARVERLFGEGANPSDIKLDAEGKLDINDVNNQAAITRFVNDSVMRPNASQRPIWGSDPHYAALWHLKSFTWTQHKVMVEAILEQAKLGNYRPAMVALVGYTPVAIAAGAMKEMLIPGDEPPWMKGGLGSYLAYGFDRSGLGGIPMSLYGNLKDPASWLGPTVDEIQGFGSIPFLDNHTVAQETLGALPFGNVLRRAAG